MGDPQGAIGKGVAWNLAGALVSKGASVLFTLFLARFLTPDVFGLMSMIAICYALADSLMSAGFGQALIRQKLVSAEDLSTAFVVNVVLGVTCFTGLWFAAPWIATFYEYPELLAPLRATGIVLIVNAFHVVQHALLTRSLAFRKLMHVDTVATAIAGAVAVGLAYAGFEVWSLVAQFVVTAVVTTMLVWRAGDWAPRWAFEWDACKRMFGFGSRLTIEGVLNVLYENSYVVVLGRFFGPESTGLYYFSRRIRDLIVSHSNAAVQKASYPVLAKLQDDLEQLQATHRKVLQFLFFAVSAMLSLMAVLASDLFAVVFRPQWWAAAPMLRSLCFAGLALPLHALGYNMLKVIGRTDILLYVGLIKKVIHLALLAATVPYGIEGILQGQILASVLSSLPYMYFSQRMLGYRWGAQMDDVMRPLLANGLAAAAVMTLLAGLPDFAPLWRALVGCVVYVAMVGLLGRGLRVPGVQLLTTHLAAFASSRRAPSTALR